MTKSMAVLNDTIDVYLYQDLKRHTEFLYGCIGEWRQAYNPPRAFKPFATCPPPPQRNHLRASIEAGELNYHID